MMLLVVAWLREAHQLLRGGDVLRELRPIPGSAVVVVAEHSQVAEAGGVGGVGSAADAGEVRLVDAVDDVLRRAEQTPHGLLLSEGGGRWESGGEVG